MGIIYAGDGVPTPIFSHPDYSDFIIDFDLK